jgi:hypothetical protein
VRYWIKLGMLCLMSLLCAVVSVEAGQPKRHETPESPLELTVSGPHFIHEGQKLPFTVQLRNRSAAPVLIADKNASIYFQLTWVITDMSGRELRQVPLLYCPVGGFGWRGPETLRMKDSDLTILQPGEKLEFAYDDVSAFYLFPRRGNYQLKFSYSFLPPAPLRTSQSFLYGVQVTYDLTNLSDEKFESLSRASAQGAVSKPYLLVLN